MVAAAGGDEKVALEEARDIFVGNIDDEKDVEIDKDIVTIINQEILQPQLETGEPVQKRGRRPPKKRRKVSTRSNTNRNKRCNNNSNDNDDLSVFE